MVLTKVSGDLISIISEIGATSNFAATLGSRFYTKGNSEKAGKYALIKPEEEKGTMFHRLTEMMGTKSFENLLDIF